MIWRINVLSGILEHILNKEQIRFCIFIKNKQQYYNLVLELATGSISSVMKIILPNLTELNK